MLRWLNGPSTSAMKGHVMFYRMFSVAALAAVMFVVAPALAATESNEVAHDGKVVSIANDKLVMSSNEGQEHSHSLAPNTKLTCDGQACQASDLKPGLKIRVTTTRSDPNAAIEVEALDRNPLFANTHDGKVVSIAGNKLVMTNDQGGDEHSHMLADNARLTCDGKACKATDLKAGMTIRVTTQKNDKNVAIRIEAIDKDANFAQI